MQKIMKEKLINLVNQELQGEGIVTTMENDNNICIKKASHNQSMMLIFTKSTRQIAIEARAIFNVDSLNEA